MIIKDFNTWEEFLTYLQDFVNLYKPAFGDQPHENILFRGQSNSSWPIYTTLERYTNKPPFICKIDDYVKLLINCCSELESVFDNKFQVPPTVPPINNWEKDSKLPFLDFWIYLRHLGFPSPLLDWTYSPYIAAFFAFEKPITADRASIFAYVLNPIPVNSTKPIIEKEYNPNTPNLYNIFLKSKSHRRHYLQQSMYTLCFHNIDGYCTFAPHSSVFEPSPDEPKCHETLYKFTFPSTERNKILLYLHQHNINSFSLFQSEESLMSTLANKYIDLNSFINK